MDDRLEDEVRVALAAASVGEASPRVTPAAVTVVTAGLALVAAPVGSLAGGARGGILTGGRELGNGLAALMGAFFGPLAGLVGVALGLVILASSADDHAMWEMAKGSFVRFLRGKLFADNARAFSLLGAGAAPGAALAGFVGGAAQPRLFKHLKYR